MIIIRNLTLLDWIFNVLLKVRFWLYRNLFPIYLRSTSSETKFGWRLVFMDEFVEKNWSEKGDGENWRVIHWGQGFHPDSPISYNGNPQLLGRVSLARFITQYKPKTFLDDYKTGEPIEIPFERSLLSTTDQSYCSQYGRFECRMTLPKKRGAHPAFWVWGSQVNEDDGFKYYTEIDCGEFYGGKDGKGIGRQCINLNFFRGQEDWKTMRAWSIRVESKNTDRQPYHEFAFEWTPDKIEFFTDGIKVFRYTRRDILDKYFNNPAARVWIVVNSNVRGEIVNKDDTDYYSEFYVDYVRAYKKI